VTVPTQLGSLVDRLRKKLVLQQMGVTMLGGLQGNIDIPKVAGDDQAVEKAENAVSAESSATFSKISLAPRRLPVFAEVSRQLLLQTSVDVEAWLRNDLAFQIAQVMDQRGISGSGTAQPFGILNTVGVGAVALGTNGAAPTYDMIVDLETLVANLDADIGALGYLVNTKTRGKLKKTLVGTNTAAEMIWDRKNPSSPLNEYKTGVTNLVPSDLTKGSGSNLSAMIFGNFNDALMGQWGGLEFLVNPYSKDTEGLIRINCWTFYDFIVRRVESFAVVKDIITT
jgi:HK97 family phage major capsid protein